MKNHKIWKLGNHSWFFYGSFNDFLHFYEVNFSAKKKTDFVPFRPRCVQHRRGGKAKKKSFKMHGKNIKVEEIYFDFFLKVADIVCAIIVHLRILMGFLENLFFFVVCAKASKPMAVHMSAALCDEPEVNFTINLLRCPVAMWRFIRWLEWLLNGLEMKYFFRFSFNSFFLCRARTKPLNWNFLLVIAL